MQRCGVVTWRFMQVLVNAGQANAATGDQGYQDCLTSAEALSSALQIPADQVTPCAGPALHVPAQELQHVQACSLGKVAALNGTLPG